ncbi:MAG: hypothetical protein ACYCZK_01225 [Microbacteriaceae bacterium]
MTLEERLNSYVKQNELVAPLTWRAVQSGLWVAEPEGEFVGMIERRGHSNFEVIDRLGRTTGFFATLEEAKASL